ncbi:McrC family protein, partial [Enterococcus cecorum]
MRVYDNSVIDSTQIIDCQRLVESIANKTIIQLEKEGLLFLPGTFKNAEDLTEDQMVFKYVNGKYHSQNIIGFLSDGKQNLTISSRFSDESNDFLFQYLITKVIQIPNIFNSKIFVSHNQQIHDLYMYLFPLYLSKALKKGIYKTYQKREYDDSNFKGTLNVTRHIRKNTPFLGKISYDQSEITYSNYVMQLVRHTIEFIKSVPNGKVILSGIADKVRSVQNVTMNYQKSQRRNIIYKNIHSPLNHAYYNEYVQLQKLCLLILSHDKFIFGTGVNKIHGVLFDAAWLWEEYIASLLETNFYHPKNKTKVGVQKLFTNHNGTQVGAVYPDFISRSNNPRIIIDAKYKPKENIGNKDYLQMLAYLYRFQSEKGFYIYPDKADNENELFKVNSGTSYERNVVSRDES